MMFTWLPILFVLVSQIENKLFDTLIDKEYYNVTKNHRQLQGSIANNVERLAEVADVRVPTVWLTSFR